MSLRTDTRGALTFHILIFFGSLVIAAILYILLDPMVAELLSVAGERTETQAAATGQQYLEWTFQSMYLFVIGLGVLQLLAAAVYEGRVTR